MRASVFVALFGLILLNGLSLVREQSNEENTIREEIRYDSDHFKIVGDLHIPDSEKQYPVIIFVHGDGPAGRSYSREPNRIMRSFLDIGFACFIYDKPGYGESTGNFTHGRLFEERASILVDAVHVLKKHPAINPKQIGLWGISQAGYVMPKAVAMTKDIAFMIAVSCPAMDSVDQSAYLVEKQILCAGQTEAEAKKAWRYFRQRANAQTYQEYLEAAEYLDKNPFIRSIRWGGIKSESQFSPRAPSDPGFFNPMTLIKDVTIPVLAIFGEKDTQIDPFQGAEVYESTLKKAGNQFYKVRMFPEADHGIVKAETGCMQEQRERRSRSYVPGYMELMSDWLMQLKERFTA